MINFVINILVFDHFRENQDITIGEAILLTRLTDRDFRLQTNKSRNSKIQKQTRIYN